MNYIRQILGLKPAATAANRYFLPRVRTWWTDWKGSILKQDIFLSYSPIFLWLAPKMFLWYWISLPRMWPFNVATNSAVGVIHATRSLRSLDTWLRPWRAVWITWRSKLTSLSYVNSLWDMGFFFSSTCCTIERIGQNISDISRYQEGIHGGFVTSEV